MKSSDWRGDGSRREWLSTLERYAFPVIGLLPVSAIDTVLVHRVLEPIWLTKPHVGQRLRERIEAVLDYAKGMKLRSEENPALWRDNLEHMLPKANRTSRKHHPALPYGDLPGLMMELRAQQSVAARALEFTILAATRTGEARFARWSEVDLRAGVWTIPGARMKGDKDGAAVGSGVGNPCRASARCRERCCVPRPQRWRVHKSGRDGGRAGEAPPRLHRARLPLDVSRLGG
jgi:integrase